MILSPVLSIILMMAVILSAIFAFIARIIYVKSISLMII